MFSFFFFQCSLFLLRHNLTDLWVLSLVLIFSVGVKTLVSQAQLGRYIPSILDAVVHSWDVLSGPKHSFSWCCKCWLTVWKALGKRNCFHQDHTSFWGSFTFNDWSTQGLVRDTRPNPLYQFKTSLLKKKRLYLFIHERGRDIGRGGSRLPAWSLRWDSIPGPQDHALRWRQMLNCWAT